MSERLAVTRNGRVVTAVNNNPGRRNALDFAFYDRLVALLGSVAGDGTGAVVLAGAGGFFSAGGDLNGLKERSRRPTVEGRREGVDRLNAAIRAVRACPVPVVAAVEGGAAGAGLALMLACDLIVAARGAYVALSHVRIGLTPDGGSTSFLSGALPRQLVGELALTGERMGIERLHQAGVVNRLCEPGEAVATAEALAAVLAEGPARAQARIKRLVAAAGHNDLDSQLELEARTIADQLGEAEAHEGIDAFLERRPARFRTDGS